MTMAHLSDPHDGLGRSAGSPPGDDRSPTQPRLQISGALEDAGVFEVMQLIHFGGRTGTLSVESGDRRAEIGFHRGKIIHGWSTDTRRLGQILADRGQVTTEQVAEALAGLQGPGRSRSLGRALVDRGLISGDALCAAIEDQIQQVVYEVVGWRTGQFLFEVEQLRPVDEIARYPGDLIPEVHLDTQKVLLEGARRVDEARRTGDGRTASEAREATVRRGPWAPAEPTGALPAPPATADRRSLAVQAPRPVRVHVVTGDDRLVGRLARLAEDPSIELVRVDLRDAGNSLPRERAPMVILDLSGGLSPEDLATLDRLRPRAPILAVTSDPDTTAAAFRAGALAVAPPDPEAICACALKIAAQRFGQPAADSAEGIERLVIGRVRRVLGDIRSGVFSATMSLSLMSIISESAERAVLLLVKPAELVSLGAFGFSPDSGEPLAQLTRGLRILRAAVPEVDRVLAEGQVHEVEIDRALPEGVIGQIGRPTAGKGILVPVIGRETVIAVIYADNGAIDAQIENLEILELATAQVGFALENELLRRLMDGEGRGRHA